MSPRQAGGSGAWLMVAAILAFVFQDATIKWLTGTYGVAQIVLLRCAVALVVVLALAAFARPRVLRTARPGMHALRGGLLLVSGSASFYAFGHLPLADAYAVFYVLPLAATLLAAILLGEPVPRRAMIAIALGLTGVGIVVLPRIGGGALAAYAACGVGMIAYALVGVTTRDLAAKETPLALLFYPCVVMVVATLPLALADWQPPRLGDLGVFVLIGLLWPAGHWLVALAFKRAPVARLTPFEYSSIVWVVAIDWLIFATPPAASTLIGSAVIILACLALMERRRRA